MYALQVPTQESQIAPPFRYMISQKANVEIFIKKKKRKMLRRSLNKFAFCYVIMTWKVPHTNKDGVLNHTFY